MEEYNDVMVDDSEIGCLSRTWPLLIGQVLALGIFLVINEKETLVQKTQPAYISPRIDVRTEDRDGDGDLETNLYINGVPYLLQEDSDSEGYTLKRYTEERE